MSGMASSYGQEFCPVARALDVIGEKWSLLILRDLFRKGPLRFQALEAGLPGIAPNTLSARLKTLEAVGLKQVAIQVVNCSREMIEEFSREMIAKY